ncbi:MAG: glycosyltransferase family 2 protein [Candidatus Nitrosotenuis sp.]
MAYVLFFTCFGFILYTYVIYPCILAIWAVGRHRKIQGTIHYETPSVSVLISAYNEEGVILHRIKNLAETNYPTEKIEFLIGSDGSTDKTNEILSSCKLPNLRPIIFHQRSGKASVLNSLIPAANGEIIVFSDANTFFQTDTIKKIVECFADPSVGAVCGNLQFISDLRTTGGYAEGTYWHYENLVKKLESDVHTTIGATGAVYAIRKELFRPLPLNNVVMDDFLIPLFVVQRGYRIVYRPDAMAFEKLSNSVVGEFRRKVRIGAANFYGISYFASLLHPRHGFVAFALWSHKIIRWFVPFLLICVFLMTVLLAAHSDFFYAIFIAEILFIGMAIFGFALDRLKLSVGVLGLPYYFLTVNVALFAGFIKYLFDKQKATWEIIR